jgi:hypothetical protein
MNVIFRYCKIIKFWCKLVNSENLILNKLYNLAVQDSLYEFDNSSKKDSR